MHCAQTFTCGDDEQLALCERCETELRDERQERMRLFEPAPAQLEGQLDMGQLT